MAQTAFVFARGGSRGLPGKNIRPLAGKPLIGWAIESALAVDEIDRVLVSTDDEEIAKVAKAHGASVPFLRPANLASDTTPEILAWRHALDYLKSTEGAYPDPFVSVPTTAPLRRPIDIRNCLDAYRREQADVVLSVTEAHNSPWFNMVWNAGADGYKLVCTDDVGKRISRRQDAPKVFNVTTVAYALNSEFVMSNDDLFAGRVAASFVPPERAIDIDTMHDFEVAEFLMNQRLAGK